MNDLNNINPLQPQAQRAEPIEVTASEPVENDGIDRRNFLSCMAWVGTGLLWTIAGGIPTSKLLAATAGATKGQASPTSSGSGLSFIQISDTHIGFKAGNQDVTATLRLALNKINKSPETLDLLLHTGDISHSSKPAEFDIAQQLIKSAKVGQAFYVPGEHDTAIDGGARYKERFGKGTSGIGWYSFTHKGVHFIGLNNTVDQDDAMGRLGPEQLKWLKADLAAQSPSTPIVVFAHYPLWMMYRDWGWGTHDGEEALSYMKRFGSVTLLNGHSHQATQKVEGNVSFHTAASTAYPKPAPGKASSEGCILVPAGKLKKALGITEVRYVSRHSRLAIVDPTLEEGV
jgi:hypothetical protein